MKNLLIQTRARENSPDLRGLRPPLAARWIHNHLATLHGPSQDPKPPLSRGVRTSAMGNRLIPTRAASYPRNHKHPRSQSVIPWIHRHLSTTLDRRLPRPHPPKSTNKGTPRQEFHSIPTPFINPHRNRSLRHLPSATSSTPPRHHTAPSNLPLPPSPLKASDKKASNQLYQLTPARATSRPRN